MRRMLGIFLTAAMVTGLAGCAGQPPADTGSAPGGRLQPRPASSDVVVSAAASLSDALGEAESAFEASHPSVALSLNVGSSGALQAQIEQGAPVDLFITAAREPMEDLATEGLVDREAVDTLATNTVVLVRPTGAVRPRDWADLGSSGVGRVALGNPGHVPAGQYGQAVLEHLGLWAGLQERLVMAEDVRQVLSYVASGEAAAGILYATDAAASRKVEIVAEAPPGSHPPVVYEMAVLRESRHPDQARAFAAYLLSGQGQAILAKYGFGVDH